MRFLKTGILKLRTWLIPFVNRSAMPYVLAVVRIRSLFSKKNIDKVVILGEYLDFSSTLNHKELKTYQLTLVASRKYTFAVLAKNLPANLHTIILVDDFQTSSMQDLLVKLKPLSPKAVLIQAGEFVVPAYNYLNRELGLGGCSEEVSDISLSKKNMRDAMVKFGCPCIKYVEIAKPEDLDKVDFFPAVIKPTISTGSAGVRLIKDAGELVNALEMSKLEVANSDYDTGYLVEEYITGRQFDFEGVVVGGKPVILGIVEECYQGRFPIFDHSWFLFNVPIDPDMQDYMENVVVDTIEKVGIDFGAFHCEAKLDSEGVLKIIEFSNRMGTGFEDRITKTTGRDFIGIYIRELLGKSVEIPKNKHLVAFERYCSSDEEVDLWIKVLQAKGHKDYIIRRRKFRSFSGVIWLEAEFEFMNEIVDEVLDIQLTPVFPPEFAVSAS